MEPLRSVKEVLEWIGEKRGEDDPPPSPPSPPSPLRPQTLVCHDMMGGYLPQDASAADFACEEACFTLVHWAYVDTFVYFSHNFVTIPPPGWVAAARTNGTRILGTLITEWEEGSGLCAGMLENAEEMVARLTTIALHHSFHGWLLNIENPVPRKSLPSLVRFVRLLRDECRRVLGSWSQVLWYDSVILTSGTLKWQDELNPLNQGFFDAADGIFLNYCWKEANLEASVELAAKSGREVDVFVGVDVFGRGCKGGGGWNTVEAVEAVRKAGASLALFAPGWLYETLPKDQFQENNHKFWSKLDNLLYCRPESLPLTIENFCDGNVSDGVFNLCKVSKQPHFLCQPSKDSLPVITQTNGTLVISKPKSDSEDVISKPESDDVISKPNSDLEEDAEPVCQTLRLFCLKDEGSESQVELVASASEHLNFGLVLNGVGHTHNVCPTATFVWVLPAHTPALDLEIHWPPSPSVTLNIHSLRLTRNSDQASLA